MNILKPNPRFVKFNGDLAGKSLRAAWYQSTGLKVTGLMAAASAVTIVTLNTLTPIENVITLACMFGGYAAAEMANRGLFFCVRLNIMGNTGKCIDRAPDKNTPPTDPYYVDAAKAMVWEYVGTMTPVMILGIATNIGKEGSYLGNFGQILQEGLLHPKPGQHWMSAMAAGLLTLYVRIAQDGYRMYQVGRGNYAVVEPPRPEAKTPQIGLAAPHMA